MGDLLELAERIRLLVAEERGMRLDQIRMSSRFEEDLGMTGDDAGEFLEKFAAEFGVDLTGIDFHKHFGPEGCNPFWMFSPPSWLQDLGKYPVTVNNLVRVAEMGR